MKRWTWSLKIVGKVYSFKKHEIKLHAKLDEKLYEKLYKKMHEKLHGNLLEKLHETTIILKFIELG